jgi:tripartite-type tricarboxylate transporter receptor subunit TctC
MTFKQFFRTLVGAAALGLALNTFAQDKPAIKLLVGFPPGGASDTVARVIGERLQKELGQTVLVENKPGIGGRLAAEALKTAGADASVYLVAPNASGVFQHLMYPASVLRYDLLTDLKPVAVVTTYPMGMAVHADVPVANLKEYVAWIKANPAKANVGTAGLGGDTHFNALQLAKIGGTQLTVVPYRGNAPLMIELVGGQLPAGMMVAGDFIQQARAGKVKPLGVLGPRRSPLMPDVATFVEQGFDTGGGDGWIGVWAPMAAPAAEGQRIEAALKKILATAEVKELFANRVMHADYRSAAEMGQMIKRELDHWGPVIKASGFTPQQ